MGSKIKKAPKKPIGTKWANRPAPINTKNDHKDFENKDSRPAKFDRKYNNNAGGSKPQFKKPFNKNGKPGMKGKRPFNKKPMVAPGPENALSKLLSELSNEIQTYCEKTFTEEGNKTRIKVTLNKTHEKYGFATMKIHMMDEKIDVRYKDLFFTASTDRNRRKITLAIMNDVGDGFAPIYSSAGTSEQIKTKLLEKDYLHKICDSTYEKLQKIKAKYAKKEVKENK